MRSEFEFIDQLKSKYGLDRIGDDCAVLPKDSQIDQVITADLLVEDIDFRLKWTKPEYLGHKALAISLSDIAAMGADPKWALLSIGIAENLWKTDFRDRFYAGWHELANKYGVELVGGDVSRSPDKLVIDSIVGGEVPKGRAILRSAAKPGDGIFVSGTLGGAAGGLALLESGRFEPNELVEKQLRPLPQTRLANQLQEHGLVSAMIDVSDGLSSDLNHLCRASGVGAAIDETAILVHAELSTYFPADQCLDLALNGGEDFELLFTGDSAQIAATNIPNVTQIGEVTEKPGMIEIRSDSETHSLDPKGYRHF